MKRAQAAVLTGAAALAGVVGASLGHGTPASAEHAAPLWAPPSSIKAAPLPPAPGSHWSSDHGAAMLWQQPEGIVTAAAGPVAGTKTECFALRVPLSDPLLLGDAPVRLALSYALVREAGWVDARIDARTMDGPPRFEVVGAQTGGATMTMVLPADTVRAQGGVTLRVALTVRTLGKGKGRLALRSVALEQARP